MGLRATGSRVILALPVRAPHLQCLHLQAPPFQVTFPPVKITNRSISTNTLTPAMDIDPTLINHPIGDAAGRPAFAETPSPLATERWPSEPDSLYDGQGSHLDEDEEEILRSTSPVPYPPHPNLSEYQFSKVIGEGSFGNVYLAHRRQDGHPCAVKVMAKADCAISSRVKCEAQILALLDHPFVIRIEAAFQNNDFLFIALQFVSNGTFYDYLEAYAPMSNTQAQFYICQLVVALDYIHSKDIVHGDVKPGNILVSESGYLKLADFGLAQDISQGDSMPHACFGTPYYMAPEMILATVFGPCNDWWALGVIMYQCMFARFPFDVERAPNEPQRFYRDDLNKVKLLIITGKYEIPHAIDQHALGLMRRLLSQSPERRNVTGPHLLAVHPAYFRGVNLVQLVQRVFIPPLRPPRPPLNPYAYRTRGAALDHARKYKDREEVRPRDPYGGFFNHFHYLKSPWVANKEGQQPFPIPPTDDMQD